jgi:membrane protease YdiL (CAAX protease family)
MTLARRIIMFPIVRIVLALAPILLFVTFATKGVRALHLEKRGVANALVPALLSLVVLALYAAYVRIIERRPVDELGARAAVAETARGFIVGAALFAVTMGILVVVGVATVGRGDGWRACVVGLLSSIGAACLEETLMRAIFFRIVEESLGTFIAVALSAALFGLLHAANPGATGVSAMAIAVEAGVLLAAAYVLTRRLWMAIGLHAAWNFTEGGVFGASVSGTTPYGLLHSRFSGPTLLSGGAFGPEASLVAVVVCLSAGVAIAVAASRRRRVIAPFWTRRALAASAQ